MDWHKKLSNVKAIKGCSVCKKIVLGWLLIIYMLPIYAGIYIGTDATPPATYRSSSNYPPNVIPDNNTAANRDCHLYYDDKGPIPPLTCSPVTPTVPAVVASAQKTTTSTSTVTSKTTVVAPVTKQDNAAQQQPLAHVDNTTTSNSIPPLTKPATTSTPVVATKTTPVVKPTPAATPVAKPIPVAPPKPMFVTTAMPGSLKANVERIVAQSHWGTVVWNLPIDYNWQGTMVISADNVQGALSQLLAEYPVQAVFYDENHIVSIEPRRVI
jgi:hypothetical protein